MIDQIKTAIEQGTLYFEPDAAVCLMENGHGVPYADSKTGVSIKISKLNLEAAINKIGAKNIDAINRNGKIYLALKQGANQETLNGKYQEFRKEWLNKEYTLTKLAKKIILNETTVGGLSAKELSQESAIEQVYHLKDMGRLCANQENGRIKILDGFEEVSLNEVETNDRKITSLEDGIGLMACNTLETAPKYCQHKYLNLSPLSSD